jgi:hypothetical protein
VKTWCAPGTGPMSSSALAAKVAGTASSAGRIGRTSSAARRYRCSLVSGTIFESSKDPLPCWFLTMHRMTQAKNNVTALELKRHLGVSYPTAWLLQHKITQAMTLHDQGRQLTGRVEIDDACLGGEVQGGKSGRGSPNQIGTIFA